MSMRRTVDLSVSPCMVCGSNRGVLDEDFTRIANPLSGRPIVRCTDCGLGFQHPKPSLEELLALYASPEYAAVYAAHDSSPYVLGEGQPAAFIAERLAVMESLAPTGPKARRMLDIGAATGAFLRVARDRGWAVQGLELGEESSRIAREKHGLPVERKTLEDARYPDASFDAVHLSHVLEHLLDPPSTLAEIRRILAGGGVLVMEVPAELGDLFARLRKIFLRRSPEPYAVRSSHITFFTPQTLRRLVEQAGFKTVSLKTPRRNAVMDSQFPLGGLVKCAVFAAEQCLRMGPNIEIIARKHP